MNAVSPDFFTVLGIPIVRGRVFTDGETDAALVTESTARRYWPGQDAVGRTITMDGRRRHIVGIVRDAQVSQAQDAISSYVYLPATRGTQRGISVLARTRVDFDGFAAAVRAETSRMDAALVVNVQPLSDNLAMLQTLSQITASVAGMLSLLALGLAAIGIYGVVAYVVTRRRREVGIRMALGASARDVRRLILGQTLRPVAVGMAIGIAIAAGAGRVLQSVLFGVSPFDPVAYMMRTAGDGGGRRARDVAADPSSAAGRSGHDAASRVTRLHWNRRRTHFWAAAMLRSSSKKLKMNVR